VIKILDNSQSNLDYFILFNRKKGAHGGVSWKIDSVHITNGYYKNFSWHEDALLSGGSYSKPNFAGSGHSLIVEVCEINIINNPNEPDTAFVLVYLDDGKKNLDCTTSTSSPTTSPAPIVEPACIDVHLELQTDEWPGDISWELYNANSGEIIWSRDIYPETPRNELYNEYNCVIQQCLKFTMYDTWGDGLSEDDGYFKFYYDGKVELQVDNTDNYSKITSKEFGSCGQSTLPPVKSPNSSPIDSPASSPTDSPTSNPTENPTSLPTTSPTSSPTANPTSSPSPTVSSSCDQGQSLLKIEFQTDRNSREQNFYILDKKNDSNKFTTRVLSVWKNKFSNGELHITEQCIDDGECYKFTFFDTGGDGICCENDKGYYRITYGGIVLHYSLFQTGKKSQYYFSDVVSNVC